MKVLLTTIAAAMMSTSAYAACSDIPNPTRFNPVELSEYQECWLDEYEADVNAGILGSLAWVRLDSQYFSAPISLIAKSKGEGWAEKFFDAISDDMLNAQLIATRDNIITEMSTATDLAEIQRLQKQLAIVTAALNATSAELAEQIILTAQVQDMLETEIAKAAMLAAFQARQDKYAAKGVDMGVNNPVFLKHMGIGVDADGNYYVREDGIAHGDGGFHTGGDGGPSKDEIGHLVHMMIADNHISVDEFMTASGYIIDGKYEYGFALHHIVDRLSKGLDVQVEQITRIGNAVGIAYDLDNIEDIIAEVQSNAFKAGRFDNLNEFFEARNYDLDGTWADFATFKTAAGVALADHPYMTEIKSRLNVSNGYQALARVKELIAQETTVANVDDSSDASTWTADIVNQYFSDDDETITFARLADGTYHIVNDGIDGINANTTGTQSVITANYIDPDVQLIGWSGTHTTAISVLNSSGTAMYTANLFQSTPAFNNTVLTATIAALETAIHNAYDTGYNTGYNDGYDDGYKDGYADGIASTQ